LKIRVDDLKDKTVDLFSEEPLSQYSSLLSFEETGEFHFRAPLAVHLSVSREYDHVRVSGRVTITLDLCCSRCLSEFLMEIDSPFTIFYLRDEGLGQDNDIELSEEDLVTATYKGDEIDFTNEIAEQIILALPIKPLCNDDCKGICPDCGADLNEAQCSCNRENFKLKFEVLKNFKV
jgi:uncharacterized protein